MSEMGSVRPANETDLGDIVRIDEKISGQYRPQVWENRLLYYLRRDPDASMVAESGGQVIGFMLGEVRSGEFGLEEPTGWIEVLAVDPDARGGGVGRRLAEAMLAHFRTKGATTVRTLVDADMDDIAAFFRSMGFEPSRVQPFEKNL